MGKVDGMMNVTINRVKKLAIAVIALPLLAIMFFSTSVRTRAAAAVAIVADDDAATTYKAKCIVCHGPSAQKHFDASESDDKLVEIVLKGKKGEKPPFMPAYGEKSITEEQAKALVAHMKSLKAAAAEPGK